MERQTDKVSCRADVKLSNKRDYMAKNQRIDENFVIHKLMFFEAWPTEVAYKTMHTYLRNLYSKFQLSIFNSCRENHISYVAL